MKPIVKLLQNPLSAFVGMGVGIFFGFNYKAFSLQLIALGDVYKSLLQMTVLPILICAIITSIANLVRNKGIHRLLGKITYKFLLFTTLFSLCGIFAGMIFKPGNISGESRERISEQVSIQSTTLEMALNDSTETQRTQGIFDILRKFVPNNIFKVLSTDNIFAILIFTVFFGFATGMSSQLKLMTPTHTALIVSFFESLFNIFTILISYILLLLPIALIFVIAGEIARSGWGLFAASAKLISIFYLGGGLLLLFNSIVIAYNTKTNLFKTIKDAAYFSLVAFTTRNSFATMPMAMRALVNKFHLSSRYTKLTFPVFLVLGRYGNIFYFALVAIFASQLYYIDIGFAAIIFLCFGTLLGGIGTAGASGFATLSILTVVLSPLGIPFETTIVILYAIDPIIDPLRSLLIVHTNVAFASSTYKDYRKLVKATALTNKNPIGANHEKEEVLIR